MTTLRTFRADNEVITTDPSDRGDYDETTWTFHAATGLEMSKTYADNSSVLKTYDAYNRLATETDARGNVTVDMQWQNGKVTSYKLTTTTPNPSPVKVIVNGQAKTITPEVVK